MSEEFENEIREALQRIESALERIDARLRDIPAGWERR